MINKLKFNQYLCQINMKIQMKIYKKSLNQKEKNFNKRVQKFFKKVKMIKKYKNVKIKQ